MTSTRVARARAVVTLLALGVGALLIGRVVPLVSPLLIALALGAVAANVVRRPPGGTEVAAATKLVLRVGVVLIGLRLPLQDIAAIGVEGVILILLVTSVTYAFTCALGDRLGLDRGLVTLVAVGFSVCGAAAIAAVEGGIRRRREDVALAMVLVTVFGSLMIVALPLCATLIGLTEAQTGLWAGAAIHEVAQVVAAASTAGAIGVALAMTIKLGRVALLAAVYMVAVRRDGQQDRTDADSPRTPLVPWFLTGFLVAATLRSTGMLSAPFLEVASDLTTVLLAAAMFGLGLGMAVRDLLPVPARAVILAGCATLVAAVVSLASTLILF